MKRRKAAAPARGRRGANALTVHFKYMFLLVNHPRGSVVLLPSSGHCATLSIDGGTPIDLSGCQVNLRGRDGQMVWGEPARERAGDRYLVRMDAIFQRQMDVKGGLIDSPIDCCALNARFVLSGGSWVEAPASNPMFADTEWTFVRPDGTDYVQPLTDRATWTLPLDQDYTLVVSKYRKGQATVILEQTISAKSSHDLLVMNDDCADGNKDCPCAKAAPPPKMAAKSSFDPGVVLREFDLLFGLMNAGLRPDPPYGAPSAAPSASGIFRSSGTELCGAGQSDPPDPPDPPNP
jgi:hypothetical protein